MNLYLVLDIVAMAIVGQPFLQRHDAAAVRIFTDALTSPQSGLQQHPKDFNLVRVGVLDPETGEIIATHRTVILTGDAWLASQQPSDQLELIKG